MLDEPMTPKEDAHAIRPSPARRGARVPMVLSGVVLVVLLAGGALLARASAGENKVALAAEPKGVTATDARATTYRPSRRYVGTLEPWLQARVGPQLVSAY